LKEGAGVVFFGVGGVVGAKKTGVGVFLGIPNLKDTFRGFPTGLILRRKVRKGRWYASVRQVSGFWVRCKRHL